MSPQQPTTAPRPELVGIVPEVPPLKGVRLPVVAERTLGNGLRIVAARRSGVPRLEARLVVPAARGGKAADAARARVFGRTLVAGTRTRSSVAIAQELQRLGGNLDAGVDAEDFVVYGSTLSSELPRFLALFSEVLTEATHPEDEVALQRDVAAQEITLALSQPTTVARQALLARLFGPHPYGQGLPSAEEVAAVKATQLRKLGAKRLRPEGSVLILVGDVPTGRALDLAEAALASWEGGGGKPGLPAPAFSTPGPTLLVDRPGSVQTTIRMGGPAIGRTHPDYPKLALANLVFGGYFVSRLVDNIREKRGYTYSPGSGVTQNRVASFFSVSADVGIEVTAPALVEIDYELRRMLAGPIDESELLSAKRYLSGTLSMSIQTQAGLAGYLSTLAVSGLPVEYLRDFPAAVDALTEDDVIEASREYLDPRRLETVLVGDASVIQRHVEALGDLELRPSS
jgi:predicted Zn-dependent peptidase